MALSDPQTVTIDGTAYTTARMPFSEKGTSRFTDPTGLVDLVILQNKGRRNRSAVRIQRTIEATDPLTSLKSNEQAVVYLMVDRPLVGFSNADLKKMVDALTAYISAGSGANLIKVLAGEA